MVIFGLDLSNPKCCCGVISVKIELVTVVTYQDGDFGHELQEAAITILRGEME
jgi:hypothetical protein